jgi:DNA-binding transcriptional LysR family regulator
MQTILAVELRHLKYFVAVAEELHFTRAAERLHIAQPPLSQQIRQLEAEFGTELLRRNRRRVELTDAGRAALEQARKTLRQAEQVVIAARRAARGELGQLRVGFSSSAPYTTLPAILRTFRARFPDVTLALHERSTEEQISLLAADAIDIGFVRLPIENAPGSLILKTVLREPLVLAIPREHRFGRMRSVPLMALAKEAFLMMPRHAAPGLYDDIHALCRRVGFTPRVAQEAVQMQTIISLVSAGLGVAIVPASIRNLQREHVVYRPLTSVRVRTAMAVAYDRNNSLAVLKSFLAVVNASRHPSHTR